MGMTEQEIRAKILELLATGVYQKKTIKDTLWIESDRKLDNVIHSLMRDGLISYTPNKGYTLKKIMQDTSKRKHKVKPQNTKSIKVLRVIFGILSIGASAVSVRNTSRYLLESYPLLWGFTIAILMSLFMVSAAAMVTYFWQRKHYFKACGLGMLWLIVTLYSMASTSIGMYHNSKESFVKKASIEKVDSTTKLMYNEYQKQAEGIQKLIDDKTTTLDRLNNEIKSYDAGSKQYANTSWAITVAEREIKASQEKLNELTEKRVAVISKNETTEVIAKTFYEEMETLFNVQASMIQFVLSLLASIFIDIIAPIGASLALFLKEE